MNSTTIRQAYRWSHSSLHNLCLLQCPAMTIEQVIQSIDEQISRLQQARALLNGTRSGKATGRGRGPRTLSAAARARIAAAQRARWARVRGENSRMSATRARAEATRNRTGFVTIPITGVQRPPGTRKLSAAARAKIAAAQRRRWARVKAQSKKKAA